jgi:two-component system response regulator RegA
MNTFRRILLVDDDGSFCERLARAMESRGFAVQTANHVDDAVEIADEFQPEAAVVDLRLPDATGIECLRQLKEILPGLRVLMLTGYGSIATAIEAVRAGAWDYLTKPADADQVLAALTRERSPAEESAAIEAPSLERVEWEHIQRVLNDCGGNVSHAAVKLGMHRRSLQRKLQKFPPIR